MNRSINDYLTLMLKGIGMGAADVVPGVSGGTVAFIVGIYEELINSIKSINVSSLKLLFSFKIKEFWSAINGNFLATVATGILISIFSLAKIITHLLENYPILVWSLFFGLVLASTWAVSKRIQQLSASRWGMIAFGTALAIFITMATPAETPNELWFIFISGAIAICAMILPGISGSFILVLLGKYFFLMDAIKNLNIPVIVVFGAGAAIGIIAFSNLLSWLLKNYHDLSIAMLVGFMLGSLNKVWPWKVTTEVFIDRHGIEKPLMQENILPNEQLLPAFGLMILGFALVLILEMISAKQQVSKK